MTTQKLSHPWWRHRRGDAPHLLLLPPRKTLDPLDQMMPTWHRCSFRGSIIFGVLHRPEGLVDGFTGGAVWHLPRRRRRVTSVWRSGVSTGDMAWWTRAGRWQVRWRLCGNLILKMAGCYNGGDGFCSECKRWSLRVYYTGWALPFCLEGVSGYAIFPVSSWWVIFIVFQAQGLVEMFFTRCRVCRDFFDVWSLSYLCWIY
jgi:hypothetical protein